MSDPHFAKPVDSEDKDESARVPAVDTRVAKVAAAIAAGTTTGWVILYIVVIFLILAGGDIAEAGAHQFVHPAAAGYIGSSIAGTILISRDQTRWVGGIVLLVGQVFTTCAIVVMAFPLFIPRPAFEWYVPVMLALVLAGSVGGSLVLR